MEQHTEVERTYSPPEGMEPPDLTALPAVTEVGEPEVTSLRAEYYDTGDLALVRAGVTLRRRTGGSDEGWHLKLPVGDGRRELRVPLDADEGTPPRQLAEVVRGWTRERRLAVVATIETTRTERALCTSDGRVLAELADDEVVGRPADGEPVAWREWELELVDGEPDLLAAADRLMAEAGAAPSEVERKILHVLGDRVPAAPPEPDVGPELAAGPVLGRRLRALVADLHRHDSQIRTCDFGEGVHQMRIVCRRLRSALAAGRPLVDRTVTDPVRDELRWLGQQLSGTRDARVVGELLRGQVAVQPTGLVWGPVSGRFAATYGEAGRAEAEHVQQVLTSARYEELLDRLDRLSETPPWSDRAEERAKDVLPRRVRKEWKRLSGRVADIDGGPHQDVAVHEARKAAKRLRYTLEMVEPVWPDQAKRMRRAVKRLTKVLGERQDTVVARQHLVRLAASADAAHESAFTYGRLHGLQAAEAERLDEAFAREWKRASRKKLRSWLS